MKRFFIFVLPVLFNSIISFGAKYLWQSLPAGGGGFVSGIVCGPSNVIYARTDVGGAYRWNNNNNSWIFLTGWLSIDQTGFMGVESIAVDFLEPNRLYMLCGTSYWNGGKTAILRSTDYGNTFEVIETTSLFKAHGNGMGRQTGEKLAVDPNKNNILFCGTRINGLFKSTNYGSTFSSVSSFPSIPGSSLDTNNGISFVIFDPLSSTFGNPTKKIFVGVSVAGKTNLFQTTNGGLTWSGVEGQDISQRPMRAVLATNGVLYITYANLSGPWGPNAGSVKKFNTRTRAWNDITPPVTYAYCGIDVDRKNPERIVCSTINRWDYQLGGGYGDRIFLSQNGGLSWKELSLAKDYQNISWIAGHAIHWAGCVVFDPDYPERIFVISGNGIFRTDNCEDVSPVWKFSVKNLEETVPLDMISIPKGPILTAIGDYDGFLYENSDITTYGKIHNPQIGTTSGLAFASLKKNFVLRAGGNKCYYSTDYGKTWTKTFQNPTGNAGKICVSCDGKIILFAPSDNTPLVSYNCGESWFSPDGILYNNLKIAADPLNSNIFYAYRQNTGEFFLSTNGAKNFSLISTPGPGADFIRCVPDRSKDIWLERNGSGLWRSTNAGQNFFMIPGVSECAAVGFGKSLPEKKFPTVFIWGKVSGITGIFKSDDEGLTWNRINDDKNQFGGPGNAQFVIGDMNMYGRVYMSTVGCGVICGSPYFSFSDVNISVKKKSVVISWTPDPDSVEYKILKGKNSNIYNEEISVGLLTTWEDFNIKKDETVYYCIKAVYSDSSVALSKEVSASLTLQDKIEIKNNYIDMKSFYFTSTFIELETPSYVTIDVLDLDGNIVNTIVDRRLDSGIYDDVFRWNATDKKGNLVPNGVYLLRIKLETRKPVIKKIMVSK